MLGDHLFYYRGGAAYSHHGICCGDGTVIHYESSVWMKLVGRRGRRTPQIVRVATAEFAQGALVRTRTYASGETDQGEQVLERAMSRLGETRYDLIGNNCEHFAVWCKTGIPISTQINAHREACRAIVQGSPLGMTLLKSASRVPGPYRGVAMAGALALAGTVYAGTYLFHRQQHMAAQWS